MQTPWTLAQLQSLHTAVLAVDYESLFSYYDYSSGAMDRGCWMVAKAIQKVAGGQLHYLELNYGALYCGTFLHAVLKLGENAFMDGQGLQTEAILLERWLCYENPKSNYLIIRPLFFFPNEVDRHEDIIEEIAQTIQQQWEQPGAFPINVQYGQQSGQELQENDVDF